MMVKKPFLTIEPLVEIASLHQMPCFSMHQQGLLWFGGLVDKLKEMLWSKYFAIVEVDAELGDEKGKRKSSNEGIFCLVETRGKVCQLIVVGLGAEDLDYALTAAADILIRSIVLTSSVETIFGLLRVQKRKRGTRMAWEPIQLVRL